ncbi:MAG: hypothetical protein LBB81_04850 [Treponema sp.]|jgi:hypothetical protein|nr:hypothetical protein [Treponema sp.]
MIDRREVLKRHSPYYTEINYGAPLSVGNGTFCFTADFTGLQTFFNEYAEASNAFPLCTMAEWGWHSYFPLDEKTGLRLTPYDTNGRTVYYAADDSGQEELFKKIRVNTHKFHLGKVGFEFADNRLSVDECKPVSQFLSLWEGVLFSEFALGGEEVKTATLVRPEEDTLCVRVVSPLLANGKLRVTIVFPYGSHKKTGADFSLPHKHSTRLYRNNAVKIERELDGTLYTVTVDGGGFTAFLETEHTVVLVPHSEKIEFSLRFEPLRVPVFDHQPSLTACKRQGFDDAKEKCAAFWEKYWNSGGFIDFSGSKDNRAPELERRITLSQYLVAIQSRGRLPPAETGLSCNSWYGKFHLEMHFWHHAHFALWGRAGELEKSLEYYRKILPAAREIASSQGYRGARWPKMCAPPGNNTPSSVAVLLIWQQPHPIMLAEMYRRVHPSEEFLREYRDVVVETAEFIKSFVRLEETSGRYIIGPPYIPVQERHDPETVLNAAFELEYFRWALRKADEWLVGPGEPDNKKSRYGEIAEKLSLPALTDGVYIAHENCPDTFTKAPYYSDHPSMLMMYGVLDSGKIDKSVMSATLDRVLEVWDKETLYGWDFPVMAMTACRLGRFSDAVDLLLTDSPKNTWTENGHNRMTGDDALPLYLPGNGGLLLAAAMMAAGFGGKKGSSFPDGFTVKTEGISAYI